MRMNDAKGMPAQGAFHREQHKRVEWRAPGQGEQRDPFPFQQQGKGAPARAGHHGRDVIAPHQRPRQIKNLDLAAPQFIAEIHEKNMHVFCLPRVRPHHPACCKAAFLHLAALLRKSGVTLCVLPKLIMP